jgi:hypothetical protein
MFTGDIIESSYEAWATHDKTFLDENGMIGLW